MSDLDVQNQIRLNDAEKKAVLDRVNIEKVKAEKKASRKIEYRDHLEKLKTELRKKEPVTVVKDDKPSQSKTIFFPNPLNQVQSELASALISDDPHHVVATSDVKDQIEARHFASNMLLSTWRYMSWLAQTTVDEYHARQAIGRGRAKEIIEVSKAITPQVASPSGVTSSDVKNRGLIDRFKGLFTKKTS